MNLLAAGNVQRHIVGPTGEQAAAANNADRVPANRAIAEMSKHVEEYQSIASILLYSKGIVLTMHEL